MKTNPVFLVKTVVRLRYVFISLILILALMAVMKRPHVYASNVTVAMVAGFCLTAIPTTYFYCYLPDEVYLKAFGLEIQQTQRIDETRESTLWLSLLVLSVSVFCFLTSAINTPFTSKDDIFVINGKIVEEFTIINPFARNQAIQVWGPNTPGISALTKR